MAQFAIKKPNAVLWSGQHSPAKIDELLASGKIDPNWMICPLGRSDQALEMRQFLQDRHVFARMEQQEANVRAKEKAIRKSIPKPRLQEWGEYLLGITFAYGALGQIVVRVFFSHLINQDWGLLHYAMLLPLWALGISGAAVWLAGFVQHRMRAAAAVKAFREGAADNVPMTHG